jgi:hypothetical protein
VANVGVPPNRVGALSYGGPAGRPPRCHIRSTRERFPFTWLFRIWTFVVGTDGADCPSQMQSATHLGIARAKKEGEPRRTLPLLGHARNAALAALRASVGDAPCSTRALIAARWLGQSVPTTGLHGELGLDNWMVLQYNIRRVGNSAHCAGQGQERQGGNDCRTTSPARRQGWGGCFSWCADQAVRRSGGQASLHPRSLSTARSGGDLDGPTGTHLDLILKLTRRRRPDGHT